MREGSRGRPEVSEEDASSRVIREPVLQRRQTAATKVLKSEELGRAKKLSKRLFTVSF